MRLFRNGIILCLGIFTILGSILSLTNSVGVEAAAVAGYTGGGGTGNCTNYEYDIDTEVGSTATTTQFCTTGTGATNHFSLSCSLAPGKSGECKDGTDTYKDCIGYKGGTSICATKVSASGTSTVTATSGSYTCQLSENSNNISKSCTKSGSTDVLKDPTECIAYKYRDALQLSCDRQAIIFGKNENDAGGSGDSSTTLLAWKVGSGWAFLTSNGGSLFVAQKDGLNALNGNDVDNACTGSLERFLGVISLGIGPASARGLQGLTNNFFDCTLRANLGEFKAELAKKNVVGAASIINPGDLKSGPTVLTGCVDKKFSELTDPQKVKAKQLKSDISATDTTTVFKVCNNGTSVGLKNGDNIDVIGADGQKATYNGTTLAPVTNTTTTTGKNDVGDAAGNIVKALFDIVAALLLWFVYLIGWAAVIVLYYLGQAILFFLRVNPAGKDFFDVAVAPWTLLISITNLMILGSFIYVGFGYLLNIKSLKTDVQAFLQNVVIIAIALNFTIVGTATVINITQGIGDVFIYSYAASKGGTTNENINSALMGSVINAIGRVSVLRCGKQVTQPSSTSTSTTPTSTTTTTKPATTSTSTTDVTNPVAYLNNLGSIEVNAADTTTTTKAATTTTASKTTSTECDITKDAGGQLGTLAATTISPITNIFTGKTGQATAALISESVFLVMICVAIYVFWKTVYMAVMRVVGLWLLMITSPIALAAYLSPIDSLRPIGKKWVDKMIKWSTFYPIFIFALVLVNLLTDKFAEISAKGQLNLVTDGTSGSDQFTLSMQVILGGIISIGALYATTNFLDKEFEGFAKQAAGIVGKYAKPFTGAYSTTARVAGKALDFTAGGGFLTKSKRGAFSRIGSGLGNAIETGADNRIKTGGRLAKTFGQFQKFAGNRAKRGLFNDIGELVEFAPYVAEAAAAAPGKLLKGFDRVREGRGAQFKEGMMGSVEKSLRKATNDKEIIDMLDGDDDLSRWAGLNRNAINQIEQQAKLNGKESPFEAEMKDRVLDAYKKASKTAGKKLSGIVGKALVESISTTFDADTSKWKPEETKLFDQILHQSADDDTLARQLFSDPRIVKFAQDKFKDLDPAVRAKLAKSEPQIQGDATDRYRAGRDLASNAERFKETSARNFMDIDGEMIRGYKDGGGDMAKLQEKMPKGYSFESEEAAKNDVNIAFGGRGGDSVEGAVTVANREVGKNFIGENNLVRKQVALRQNKLTFADLKGNAHEDLEETMKAVTSSISGYKNMSDKEKTIALSKIPLNFKTMGTDEQQAALDHIEAKHTESEFGVDVVNDKQFLKKIQTASMDDLLKTSVGQEARIKIGDAEFNKLSPDQQKETIARVVATKAQAYQNSRSQNQSRIKEASARYAVGYDNGTARARIHGIVENTLAEAQKNNNYQDEKVYQAVGAAKIQEKFETNANQGNKKISDILGPVAIDADKDNLFINTTNENQRKRLMRKMSNTLADYHSKEPNAKANAIKVFKDEFGIDLAATTRKVEDPNNPNQFINEALTINVDVPDPSDPTKTVTQTKTFANNAEMLEDKFKEVGKEYMVQYTPMEEDKNAPTGANNKKPLKIDVGRANSYYSRAVADFENKKKTRMDDELANTGGENFASKSNNIFSKFNFE